MWERSWPEHNAAAITALYAGDAFRQKHPFRDPAPGCLVRVFAEEESAVCRFGVPLVAASWLGGPKQQAADQTGTVSGDPDPPPGLILPRIPAARAAGEADVVIAFVARRDDLPLVEQALAAARADRLAWISYPKGGQLGTDLNRDRLAAALSAHGVQPVRQVSIDGTWSALRFRPVNP